MIGATPNLEDAAHGLWSKLRAAGCSTGANVIQDATRDDLGQILAIYNEVIRNSTAVYSEEEFTPDRGAMWFRAKMEHGFPMIVARDASGITGFATFGEFRAWPCYQHTVEHSVHVRVDRRGQGIGRALVVGAFAARRRHGQARHDRRNRRRQCRLHRHAP